MTLTSFGYASLRSDKIDDWADYGAKFLGLQLVERTKSALKFRMDDRKQRIVIAREAAADAFLRLGGRGCRGAGCARRPAGSRPGRRDARAGGWPMHGRVRG